MNKRSSDYDFPTRFHVLALAGVLAHAEIAFAGGTVSNCTQADLEAALTGGGLVTFACSGTITLTNTLTIAQDTTLDANGFTPTISGGGTVRLFQVASNVSFAVKGLWLADGRFIGANGADGDPPGPGQDGAGACILNQGGIVALTDCTLTNHLAQGGKAGWDAINSANNIAPHGKGLGGGIASYGGQVNLTNCLIVSCVATGAMGNINTIPSGAGWGGAVFVQGGTANFSGVTCSNNLALGGAAAQEGPSSFGGGEGAGGAIYAANSSLWVMRSNLSSNTAAGGFPLTWIWYGARNGDGHGGALFLAQDAAGVFDQCSLLKNRAIGAPAWQYDAPGFGRGGAVFSAGQFRAANSTFSGNFTTAGGGGSGTWPFAQGGAVYSTNLLVVTGCTFAGNVAQGGNGGATTGAPQNGLPGSDGQGGAVWNSGLLLATNCTWVSNRVASGEGGYYNPWGYPARGGDAYGGAICSSGLLSTSVLVNVTIAANRADPAFYGLAFGGGLCASSGLLVVIGCTFTGNLAQGGSDPGIGVGPGADGQGGAIWNSGLLLATNCTWASNRVAGGDGGYVFQLTRGGDAYGGAIYSSSSLSTSVLVNVTIAANRADPGRDASAFGGGLCASNGGPLVLRNSIIAYSANGGNVWGGVNDGGYNLSSDNTASFSAPGSLNNTDPLLATLADNGGPTATMMLPLVSPAADIIPSGFPPTDQRGVPRPSGFLADMGAVEAFNPDALFAVHGARSNGSLMVFFGAVAGHTYRLLGSTDLVTWAAVDTNSPAITGPLQFLQPATNPMNFFRVVSP